MGTSRKIVKFVNGNQQIGLVTVFVSYIKMW